PTRVAQKFFGSGGPASVPGSTRGDLYFNTAATPIDVYECQNSSTCAASGGWNKGTTVGTHQGDRMIGLCDSSARIITHPVWAVDTGAPAAATCGTGLPASFTTAYRILTNAADSGFRTTIPLPLDWDSTKSSDLQIYWAGTTTANQNVTFGVSTSCLADG